MPQGFPLPENRSNGEVPASISGGPKRGPGLPRVSLSLRHFFTPKTPFVCKGFTDRADLGLRA